MNITKEAKRDAVEYARAQMFYGEGAGIRRKLIETTVKSKMERNASYARAFKVALGSQDMAEHAAKARKERRRLDATADVGRNLRGVLTGNYRSVNTGVLACLAVGYVAHQTGLDKKAYKEIKFRYTMIKAKWALRKSNAILVDFPKK